MKRILSILASIAMFPALAGAQRQAMTSPTHYTDPTVYEDENVSFRQIDEHTWHGNGNLCYNEAIYIIEGTERALVLDCGTTIPGLRKVIESITDKPIILAFTHLHPDHSGIAVNEFDEVWFFPESPETVNRYLGKFQGTMKYLTDGMTFDLGGRQIHVYHTPGHTFGSATFLDYEAGYGFSGDSFGSTNLLLNSSIAGLLGVCTKMLKLMDIHNIKYLYPGHYHGDNLETREVLYKEIYMCEGLLAGELEGEASSNGMMGRSAQKTLTVNGTNIVYNESAL